MPDEPSIGRVATTGPSDTPRDDQTDRTLRRIVAGLGEAVVVLDADERLVWANPVSAKLLGYDVDAIPGLPFKTLLAEADLLSLTGVRAAFDNGSAPNLHLMCRHKDGTPVPLTACGGMIASPDGEATWMYFVMRDESALRDLLNQTSREVVAEKEQLARANEALQAALDHQKQTEIELRHAQKLKAVGQLASGIAHEMNTPIQFVSDSAYFLRDAFAEVNAVMGEYVQVLQSMASGAPSSELLATLKETEAEADLEYVRAEIPLAFERTFDGLARIAKIVRAMREFGHPDQKQKRPADINQAIVNTLTVAVNEYKYVADVETDFGVLPLVRCHIGDLGQVFINLVVNAAHAVADVVAHDDDRGAIRISTRHDGNTAIIAISDTGAGIPQSVRERIFEPFFTTKEVGKGTGQGLAIAHSIIVDKHFGSIEVQSEVGRGTSFILRLPIDGVADRGEARTHPPACTGALP